MAGIHKYGQMSAKVMVNDGSDGKGRTDVRPRLRPQLRWSHSFSSDRQKPSVTLIRRKSAVERLAESKYNYIKCSSPVDNGLTENHKLIHRSLSTSGKLPLIILSQSSQQSSSLLPMNQNNKFDSSLLSSSLLLTHSNAATPRKRNSSLSSRLSEGSNNHLEIQLRQLINEDNDNELIFFDNNKRDVAKVSHQSREKMAFNDIIREPVYIRSNNNKIDMKRSTGCQLKTSSQICEQREPKTTSKSIHLNVSRQLNISRSKSDASHRLISRRNKSKDEIERFFETLGLDSSVWDSIKSEATNSMISTPPHYFDSFESFNSRTRRINMSSSSSSSSTHSNVICNEKILNQLNTRLVTSRSCHALSSGTSIVEKNARVIKWLFNCRKAMLQH